MSRSNTVEVDEVQAEALGDDACELVVAQDAALDEHHAGGAPLVAGGGDALLDGLAVGEAEVDDDLADHPLRAPGMARRVQALLLLLIRPAGRSSCARRRPGLTPASAGDVTVGMAVSPITGFYRHRGAT